MHRSETNPGSNTETTVLDMYFAETAKGPEHCRQIAMQVWNTLTPQERLELQSNASQSANGDLALSAAYARSILLLEYVNLQAATAATTE